MGTLERRRREKDERRNRIIASAEKVFLSRGYQATTMDDVASEAELGKGTLYLYFKNKDEIILALAMRLRMRILDGFDEAIAKATSGLDLLQRLADVYCEIVQRHSDLFLISFQVLGAGFELDPTTPTYALWRESGDFALRIVVNALERGKRDGTLRPDIDAPMAAMHMFNGAFGATLTQYAQARDAYRTSDVPGSAELVRSYLDFFIVAVANPVPGDRGEVMDHDDDAS